MDDKTPKFKVLDKSQFEKIFQNLQNTLPKKQYREDEQSLDEGYIRMQQSELIQDQIQVNEQDFINQDDDPIIPVFIQNQENPVKTTQNQINSNKKQSTISCSCKNIQCNKKYCECFANGQKCNENCKCTECLNNYSDIDYGEIAKHKCCSCKKSKCIKNYCECFNQGIFCNSSCTCVDCHNVEQKEKTKSDSPLILTPQDSPILTNC